MRRIAVVILLLTLAGVSRASGPDDQYLDIYNEVLQADNLQKNGHAPQAVERYLEAQSALKKLQAEHPNWNSDIVNFRLDYVAEQLQTLAKAMPAAPVTPPAVAPPTKNATEVSNAAAEISGLQEQIRSLTAANGELENKLKEALSVQPAAVSPRELAKAQEKATALQKENDLLTVELQQAKAAKPAAAPSAEADDAAKKLVAANQALADFKAQASLETTAAQTAIGQLKDALAEAQKKLAANAGEGSLKDITAERDRLKEELAARTKDLADAESRRDLVEARAKLAEVERQRDELQAKLAVIEATAVPYTPEELAVMKANPSVPPAQLPASPPEKKHIVHTMKDLPPGAGALMTEAYRASQEGDYKKEAEKYQEILRQDENNVYVLSYLAKSQYMMNQLDECESTVKRALALDPEDAPSLYLLGILRYRQDKLDEALDALSRSAKYNATNAGTQNYLGCVLTDKGLRSAAETAFRKALASDPNYPDAHFNLALVYAQDKPPSLELARWHYQKAVELGHPKNSKLEKLLGQSQ